jgi:hypothetical protein
MGDIGTYIMTKTTSMIGGFLGGATVLAFIKPQTIGEAFTRGSISTGSAMIFGVPLLQLMEMPNNWENQLMIGFCVGFLSYSILGMVANFLKRNRDKDIVEVINDIKK